MKQILVLVFSIIMINVHAQDVQISQRLKDQLLEKTSGKHHLQISLNERIDVYQMDKEMTAKKMPQSVKAPIIIKALQENAKTSQKDLLQFLKNHPLVDQNQIRPYWISNVIYAHVESSVVDELAKRNDISMLDINGETFLIESLDKCEMSAPQPDNIEPGLLRVNAPELWKMGYTGRGTVAFGADTGIQEDHPAINGQYRGLYLDPSETWYDWDGGTEPSDCGSHGNHTLGTIIGLSRLTNDTIGMAPNATYIGAKILCGGIGTEDNVGAFQWAMDPDGDPNTISDLPTVINNSWRDPSLQGECTSIYVDLLMGLEAVGVTVIFSAGNEGPGNMTITRPHNINYDIINNFVVGALDGNSTSLTIADFSSRGPSLCGGDSSILIKPEVSAPGVNVRSCGLNGEYILNSGTSMASPHVAGAVLLLAEAFPDLGPRDFKSSLYFTARDLGADGEDNTYGMGIIDVKAAYDYLVAEGNVPVDPSLALDAVLYHVRNKEYFCGNDITPELFVENLGTEAIEKMSIEISVPEINFTSIYEWNGMLMPTERIDFLVTEMDLESGVYEMFVTINTVNEQEDENFYNNRLKSSIIITDELPIEVARLDENVDGVCEGTSALIEASYPGNKEGEIRFEWYDDLYQGNLVGEGSIFSTPKLDQDTTFFAEMQVGYTLGEKDNTIGPVESTIVVEGGISFDAALDFTLESVTVFTQIRNIVSIVIVDGEGENLVGDHFRIEEKGKNVIEMNWDIPAGNDYKMEVIGITPLEYNTEGANFPYDIEGVLTLTGNSIDSTGNENPYYCFYDWNISHNSVCGRTPIDIEVMPATDAPFSSFSISDSLVFLDLGGMVSFTSMSTNASTYEWDFGDGTVLMAEENPSHSYSTPGIYQVVLKVMNDDGCDDFHTETVIVKESSTAVIESHLDSRIDVFPNPATDMLFINTNSLDTDGMKIEIVDLLGRTIQIPNIQQISSGRFELELSNVEGGTYFVLLHSDELSFVTKIIKL